jgi:hypothetical protein
MNFSCAIPHRPSRTKPARPEFTRIRVGREPDPKVWWFHKGRVPRENLADFPNIGERRDFVAQTADFCGRLEPDDTNLEGGAGFSS